MFNVGDKVLIVRDDYNFGDVIGYIGEILKVYETADGYSYDVSTEWLENDDLYFYEHELKKVSDVNG